MDMIKLCVYQQAFPQDAFQTVFTAVALNSDSWQQGCFKVVYPARYSPLFLDLNTHGLDRNNENRPVKQRTSSALAPEKWII